MKSHICGLLILAILALVLLAPGAFSEGDFTYTTSGNQSTVTGYTGVAVDVQIPSTLGGHPVTVIGERAFFLNTSIKSVAVPEGVTTISSSAFNGCTKLESVALPSTLITFHTSVFYNCTSLKSAVIPEGVFRITSSLFENCESLESVSLPSTSTIIGGFAFSGCKKLRSVAIPASVKTIEGSAFAGCASIESVVIPEGVDTVSSTAFSGCTSLRSAGLPSTIKSIGTNAFNNCTSLRSINIPAKVTSIGVCAFNQCSSLENIAIPEGVTTIENGAFGFCASLKSASLPSTLKSIGEHAFYGCRSLAGIDIPGGVTQIRYSAFQSCTSLTSVVLREGLTSLGPSAFDNCKSLKSISLPGTLRTIGNAAFAGCVNLRSIVIPEGTETVDDSAFSNCAALAYVKLPTTLETVGTGAFSNCGSLKSIVIPDGIQKTLESSAFFRSEGYDRLNIWASSAVTSFGNNAFYGCNVYCPRYSYVYNYARFNTNVTVIAVDSGGGYTVFLPDEVWMGVQTAEILRGDIFPPGGVGTWSSSDEDVALIEPDGTIIADEIGTSTITLSCGAASDSFTLHVERFMAEFELNEDELTVESGETAQLALDSHVPANATNTDLLWTSDDKYVATVDQSGVVTGGNTGSTVINASTRGGVVRSCTVNVIKSMTDFTLSETELYIESGTAAELALATFEPGYATETQLSWSIADELCATVDEDGVVSAHAPGDVVVTATSNKGIERTCLVHVVPPVVTVSFDQPARAVAPGASIQLTATAATASGNYTNKLVSFTSSNEAIATVDKDGLVTGVAMGSVQITAQTLSGKSAACTVRVQRHVISFTLSALSVTADVGMVLRPEAEVKPFNATDPMIVYESDDPDVAVGFEGGFRITGVGTATVTASSRSNPEISQTLAVHGMEMRTQALPAGLKRIEAEALSGTIANRVVLPAAIERIGARAFAGNSELYIVEIPAAAAQIDPTAFEGCPDVLFLCAPGSTAQAFAKDNAIPYTLLP